MGLSALEGGTHWHYLARAGYEAFIGTDPPLQNQPDYKDLPEISQRAWKNSAIAIAQEFGGKVNGNLVYFDGKETARA